MQNLLCPKVFSVTGKINPHEQVFVYSFWCVSSQKQDLEVFKEEQIVTGCLCVNGLQISSVLAL